MDVLFWCSAAALYFILSFEPFVLGTRIVDSKLVEIVRLILTSQRLRVLAKAFLVVEENFIQADFGSIRMLRRYFRLV